MADSPPNSNGGQPAEAAAATPGRAPAKAEVAPSEPNTDNKLFVGGCPPGSGEHDLRKVFEEHGEVEEIFIMRGGSRSGMVCAFVRFLTQESAQKAIDTIHGQIALPNAAEPLVVRWADAPGSRRRDAREKGGKQKGPRQGGMGGGMVMMGHMAGEGGQGYGKQNPYAYGMELFVQQQGWPMHPYMQLGQNPYAYGGGGGGGNGGGDGNMGQNPYAYVQHPMMFSMPQMGQMGNPYGMQMGQPSMQPMANWGR
mmetsp:Transcript_18408/g.46232  ORF Transcript_18408/g.46232 Transcript_18408/m.46232 type:complete len:253 (+) Transcript_18408:79-837(+)